MALSKQAKARIMTLVKFMESLPKSANKHFDMDTYISHQGQHNHFAADHILSKKDLHTCGTSACALGWAATIPSFKKAGLCLSIGWGVDMLRDDGRPVGKYSDEVAEEFFDIEAFQQHSLFGSHNDIKTPKQWARRARGLIKQWEKTA